MNIDNPEFQKKMWMEAIALRVDEMVSGHPEIDSDSRALLVEAVIAGLHAHPKMLGKWQEGNSFIEHSYFGEESQDNTKLGSRKRSATKVSHVLSNGVNYSITGPYYNGKRSRNNDQR
jgi:hypothetical protein